MKIQKLNESVEGFKTGDRVELPTGETALVKKDQQIDDDRVQVEIEGMGTTKYVVPDLLRPINESKSINEELWDKSRVTDLVTYYLDRGNTPINTLGSLIKSQMEKEGSKLPYNITDFYDQLYMAVDRYNAQFDESLKESATHCVYFTQDGEDQIEFEGTEDECNKYISDIQAEQDDEFGDEAPERFVKKLTEAKVFGHNIIHVGDDLVSKSGHKIHIDDIVATLSPFEKNAIVTFYYTYEMTDGETGSSQCSTFDLQNMLNESLKEDIEEEARTAGRYLDYEVPEMCAKVLELIDNLPESKLAFISKVCRDFNAKLEYVLDGYTMTNNESLTEDIETETLEGPKEGPEYGLASLLNSAIQEEYKTVESYNSLALTAADEGFDDIVDVINEINTEENKHIGQLQELLKTIAPNAEAIDIGAIEGEQQIEEDFNADDNDFDLATEFGINGDDDISDDEMMEALNEIEKAKNSANNSTNIPNNINDGDINEIEEEVVDMREAWEDIYDSFKQIETNLNGDGEAITATIDKLYQDNKENPDFKKAYDKWASGN